MINYIVVSSSKCLYQKWQLELLNWSRKKVGQEGKLIVLLSDDVNHHNEEVEIDLGSDVTIYELPDYAKEWELDNDDWWGGIPNKYESIKWLADQDLFKDSDNLFFLDPDMIFVEPFSTSVKDNQVYGQNWEGYVSNLEDELEKSFSVMYPFVINYKTLKKVVNDYKDECIRLRKESGIWEAEMHGLDSCLKKNNIDIQVTDNLGRCTVWNTDNSQTRSKLIHFPNKIESSKGENLFFKQDYTFDKTIPLNIESGRNVTDRELLSNIDQSRTDFLYWLKWEDNDLLSTYTGEDGYIGYKAWPGGFNNVRMSLELAVSIAFITNRTLILPKPYNIYLLTESNSLDFFFNCNDLGIKTIDFDSFCRKENIYPDYENIEQISKVIEDDLVSKVLNFEWNNVPESFLKGRELLDARELVKNDRIIFFKENLLGSFYQSLFTKFDNSLKHLNRKYIRYTNFLFDQAWRYINYLGDKSFYSIHLRRNDFQYKDLLIPAEQVLENIQDIVPEGSKLYIATDHDDPGFFEKFKDKYDVYFYKDLISRDSFVKDDHIPIIEQLICSRGIKFIGTKLSTLSSYIFRLRGYMDDIENKEYFLNTEKFNIDDQVNFLQDSKYVATWAREYPDCWELQNKKIFLSIASYCDSQLDETIESAIKNVSTLENLKIVVHLQDTKEAYNYFTYKKFPNTEFIYTHKDESKGVVWARNKIKEKIDGENFFLQVDSHTRFKENWDLILTNSWNSLNDSKGIITTYPNHFDYPDPECKYLELTHNAPLRINKFLHEESEIDNRCIARNRSSLEDYELDRTRWAAAGFFFAPIEWTNEVIIPDNIKFNGEEDHLTFLSFLKGWNLYTTPEAVVWHNYGYKNITTDEKYRDFHIFDLENEQSIEHVNRFLFEERHERSVEDLEDYFYVKLRDPNKNKIFISLNSLKDPELLLTVQDCVNKADDPSKLVFGIHHIYDNSIEDTHKNILDNLLSTYNIKVKYTEHSKLRGNVNSSKREAVKFYNGEKYFLNIGSQTRLVKGWDTKLIDLYNNLSKKDTNPVISFLPPVYYRNEDLGVDYQFEDLDNLKKVNIPIIQNEEDITSLSFDGINKHILDSPLKTPFLYSDFMFTSGDWIEKVNFNKEDFYNSNDLTLSLRTFVNEFNIYIPDTVLGWTRFNSVDDTNFKPDKKTAIDQFTSIVNRYSEDKGYFINDYFDLIKKFTVNQDNFKDVSTLLDLFEILLDQKISSSEKGILHSYIQDFYNEEFTKKKILI